MFALEALHSLQLFQHLGPDLEPNQCLVSKLEVRGDLTAEVLGPSGSPSWSHCASQSLVDVSLPLTMEWCL